MAIKFLVFATALAAANAGNLLAPAPLAYSAAPAVSHISYSSPLVSYGTPTITSQDSNTYRSFGNLGQVSTYSKTLDTPYSSVRKTDIRVSNPGLRIASGAPIATYGAPIARYGAPIATYGAPVATYGAPLAHATYAAPAPAAIGVAYSAAPAVSHVTYTGLGASYGW